MSIQSGTNGESLNTNSNLHYVSTSPYTELMQIHKLIIEK